MTQAEYRKMVFKYFKDYDVNLSLKMQTWYTSEDEMKETSICRIEYARKSNGIWLDSGLMISGKAYFAGSERCGFLLDAQFLRTALKTLGVGMREIDNRKFYMYPRKEALVEALMITYFKKIVVIDHKELWGK